MTSLSLAQSYIKKATDRMDVLDILFRKGAYSDVIREAQEIVELCLKAMLRSVGVEPPKVHDVSLLLLEHRDRFGDISGSDLEEMANVSKRLRKERELSFYGDIDFIPTEEYSADDAEEAMKSAMFVLHNARKVVK